jgi:hypothetical protein
MPELTIRIKKNSDGSAALSCTRADGSVTWQRQPGQRGRFFPFHDLTHYTVEHELGFARGFFGLIAAGWDIPDTGGKSARGPLPPEALVVEHIVGALDAERNVGAMWTTAEFNEHLALAAPARQTVAPPTVNDEQLARLHATRHELFARWRALPPGDSLELPFDRRSP